MLYVEIYHLGRYKPMPEDYMWHSPSFFDLAIKDEDLCDQFARACIKDLENANVIAPGIVELPDHSTTAKTDLSSSCKTVLCMRYCNQDFRFDLSQCNAKALPWVIAASKETDVHIFVDDQTTFDEYSDEPCVIENTREKGCLGDIRCRQEIVQSWNYIKEVQLCKVQMLIYPLYLRTLSSTWILTLT